MPPDLQHGVGPDGPIPATFADAIRGMADKPFLSSQKWQEQQWRANREGAHPEILEFEKVFLRAIGKHGIPMFAHCVIRTQAEQFNLLRKGVTRDSPADGYWPHKAGAIDLVHSVKAWNLHQKQWAVIGHVGKEAAQRAGLKVEWGGDWKFYDPAHWQLKQWRNAAEGYPWPTLP